MSDHIDRAAEIIGQHTPDDVPGYRLRYAVDAARALEDAGLLVTPEHDAAVAARALRGAGESDEQSRCRYCDEPCCRYCGESGGDCPYPCC